MLLLLQERLGEVPAHEDGRTDKNVNGDSQQTTDWTKGKGGECSFLEA